MGNRLDSDGMASTGFRQIGIESRGYQPNERPAFFRHRDSMASQASQTFTFKQRQRLTLRPELVSDIVPLANASKSTEKSHINRSMIAPRTRSSSESTTPLAVARHPAEIGRAITANVRCVLDEALCKPANCRRPKSDQCFGLIGRVVLKISAQPTAARCDGEIIVRQCEMIEADRHITPARHSFARRLPQPSSHENAAERDCGGRADRSDRAGFRACPRNRAARRGVAGPATGGEPVERDGNGHVRRNTYTAPGSRILLRTIASWRRC